MGVSVSEGTVSRWLKAEGEHIGKDETLLEISTDKVDTEVPSPAEGTVTKILAQEGDTLDVGAKLAEISVGGDGAGTATVADEVPSAPPAQAPEAATPAPAAPAPAPVTPAPVAPPTPAAAPAASSNGSASSAPAAGGRFVSPVVARIAAEQGIDPNTVPGTGSGGRVTKKDIVAFIEQGGAAATATAPTPAMAQAQAPAAAAPSQAASAQPTPAAIPVGFTGTEEVVNFNAMRKAIARHMVESKHTSPHVTSTMEVDMTRIVRMRDQVKDEIQRTWGVKVTFTHFVIRALIDAIAHWPLVNAEIRGESAVVKRYLNLGVAVALNNGEGLIVPVIKNAEERNLVGIARAVNDLADRARTKRLSPDDVTGGTFTLTNPGAFGAIHGTPIINQPQVAILDTEAIVKRPVVITDAEGNDTIAIRSMMNLCMSYDHRLVDGAYAVQFLAHLKRNLQEWDYSRFSG
jgi:2-oxoglutarate dehydrogenase E2 component (dihydrolipoamide succinyltransferase)